MKQRWTWWTAALAAACVLGLALPSCSGDSRTRWDDDDDDGAGGNNTGGNNTGGSPPVDCTPGQQWSCYTGPPETENVGVCVPGLMTCDPNGVWGPCEGDVLPSQELCATEGDDDCDGLTNEDGPDCQCTPNEQIECYSGPPATKNVGICVPGTQTCNPDGNGYGPCTGEVLPGTEDCVTPEDEDCDGQTPACPGDPVIDLRADVNRNGTVDLYDGSEDSSEDTWDANHGAVFLANIDDDQNSCPTSGTNDSLAACNDAADDVVNGNNDLIDMARLKTVPWPEAPNDAFGSVSVTNASRVRLFKNSGGNFQLYAPGTQLSFSELQAGVELAIEAKDFIRDDAVWDGYVDVTFDVEAGTGPNGAYPDGSDTLRMRVAPVLFRHHLDEGETLYATASSSSGSIAFRNDLKSAMSAAGVPNSLWELTSTSDQWTQDFFETAYMAMPAVGGPHVIHVNFRSANCGSGTSCSSSNLRSAGRVVFTVLRGPDVAGAVEYDPGHSNSMDSLNSFGNLETLPPHGSWTMGRVVRGSTGSFYPDQDFEKMVAAQGADSNNGEGIQDTVEIDTEFLLVGHIDETFSYMPHASGTHGWVLIASDTALGWNSLIDAHNNGYGNTTVFQGKSWYGGPSAQTTITNIVSDQDLYDANAWAAAEVDNQIEQLKQAVGLVDTDFVSVPAVWWTQYNYLVAYVPGVANGISLSHDDYAAPDPWGPVIGGQDLFKSLATQNLNPLGFTTHWVEDWDLYHRLDGEIHCGSNTTREIPNNVFWWESGK